MSIIGMNGCEAGAFDDDNIIGLVLGVTGGYVTNPPDLPVGSATSRALYSVNHTGTWWRSPWVAGEVAGSPAREPSGTVYWFGFHYWSNRINTINYVGVGRSGTELITITPVTVGGGAGLALRVAGSQVITSADIGYTGSAWHRYHVYVDQQVGGEVRIYYEGDLNTPIITYTLTGGDIAALAGKPNEFIGQADGITTNIYDDLFALDPADGIGITNIQLLANASIQSVQPTGAGTYAAWNGTFADIDEIPASDVDYIDTAVVDSASTFAHEAAVQPAVHFAQSKFRMTRTGSDAGVQMQARIRHGVTDKDETITSAPGSGNVVAQHHTAPDGTAWNKTKFDATEFGIVART